MAFASDKVLPPVKRLYVPFTAMISAHFNNFFVKKTKVTIWAESTIGISPFFSFQKFYRTVIKLNKIIVNRASQGNQ